MNNKFGTILLLLGLSIGFPAGAIFFPSHTTTTIIQREVVEIPTKENVYVKADTIHPIEHGAKLTLKRGGSFPEGKFEKILGKVVELGYLVTQVGDGSSMEPLIKSSDWLICDEDFNPDFLEGSIIVFNSTKIGYDGGWVVHRCVSYEKGKGCMEFGINNVRSAGWVPVEDIVCEVKGLVRGV